MKKYIGLGVLAIIVAGAALSGALSGNADDVMEEMVKAMREIGDTLDTIQDEASAQAAKPRLEQGVGKLQEINERAAKVRVTKSEDERITQKYQPKLNELQQRFLNAGLRLRGVPGALRAGGRLRGVRLHRCVRHVQQDHARRGVVSHATGRLPDDELVRRRL